MNSNYQYTRTSTAPTARAVSTPTALYDELSAAYFCATHSPRWPGWLDADATLSRTAMDLYQYAWCASYARTHTIPAPADVLDLAMASVCGEA